MASLNMFVINNSVSTKEVKLPILLNPPTLFDNSAEHGCGFLQFETINVKTFIVSNCIKLLNLRPTAINLRTIIYLLLHANSVYSRFINIRPAI